MTSGEGCTRPSSQGMAKANFLLRRLSSSNVWGPPACQQRGATGHGFCETEKSRGSCETETLRQTEIAGLGEGATRTSQQGNRKKWSEGQNEMTTLVPRLWHGTIAACRPSIRQWHGRDCKGSGSVKRPDFLAFACSNRSGTTVISSAGKRPGTVQGATTETKLGVYWCRGQMVWILKLSERWNTGRKT